MSKLAMQQNDELNSNSLLFGPASSCFGVDDDMQGIETTADASE